MNITSIAVAGTLESSDIYVEVEPCDTLELDIESVVLNQFGEEIRATILSVLEELGVKNGRISVQDKGANYTRFVCISKELELYPGAEHTSLMMVISQKPGSLYRILSSLNASGVNITKLESRPIPDRDFEARFYVDLDLSIYDPEFARTLAALERECEELRYLGTYNEII